MAASSYYPRILNPKYGLTANVKPLTANRGLPFSVRWLNLDLKGLRYYMERHFFLNTIQLSPIAD